MICGFIRRARFLLINLSVLAQVKQENERFVAVPLDDRLKFTLNLLENGQNQAIELLQRALEINSTFVFTVGVTIGWLPISPIFFSQL